MTGDGGEYLRAEDLRELGDDSLPGHYLDGMSYTHNLDRYTHAYQFTFINKYTQTQCVILCIHLYCSISDHTRPPVILVIEVKEC